MGKTGFARWDDPLCYNKIYDSKACNSVQLKDERYVKEAHQLRNSPWFGIPARTGIAVQAVQAVDVFPHATHVEAIVLLQRANS